MPPARGGVPLPAENKDKEMEKNGRKKKRRKILKRVDEDGHAIIMNIDVKLIPETQLTLIREA